MKNVGLTKFRMITSVVGGVFLILESLNPKFWATTISSNNGVVHGFIALFGAAWLAQAFFLRRQLCAEDIN